MDHEGSTKVLTKYKVQYNTTNKGKTDRQRAPHWYAYEIQRLQNLLKEIRIDPPMINHVTYTSIILHAQQSRLQSTYCWDTDDYTFTHNNNNTKIYNAHIAEH